MTKTYFKSYIWLLETLQRRGPLTLAQIRELWRKSSVNDFGSDLPARTFYNHIRSISDIFGIYIVCDRRDNTYYIENDEDMDGHGIRTWMLDSLSLNSALNESAGMKERIFFENVPSNHNFLIPVIQAIRDNRRVKITYQPFYGDEPFELELQPLFAKLYQRRWYLYADKPTDAKVKLYALDRMQSVAILEERFELPEGFSPAAHLAGAFGVAVYDDIKPCTIRIRACGDAVKYLRTLPLHASQTEVETAADSSIFAYYVAPTREFYNAILSLSDTVEVLSPAEVRSNMAKKIEQMNNKYNGR